MNVCFTCVHAIVTLYVWIFNVGLLGRVVGVVKEIKAMKIVWLWRVVLLTFSYPITAPLKFKCSVRSKKDEHNHPNNLHNPYKTNYLRKPNKPENHHKSSKSNKSSNPQKASKT